ncbi:transmembrane and coiled-coil domain protein 3-like isoform X1 [Styela clava]
MPSKKRLARKGPSSTSLPEWPTSSSIADRRKREFVVITPPSIDMEEPFQWETNAEETESMDDSDLSISSLADSDSVVDISLDYSQNDQIKQAAAEQKLSDDSLLNLKKPLSISRSCGNISTKYSYACKETDSKSLQVPKRHKTLRSQSAEYCKNRLPKFLFPTNQTSLRDAVNNSEEIAVNQKRSQTPQPRRKYLSKSRSSSPVNFSIAGSQIFKGTLGETSLEGTKAAWARTLRFLTRRQMSDSTSSANATRDFIWHDSVGSTSDGTEGADNMIITQNAADSYHIDGSNGGYETPIIPNFSTPLGSAAGSTSSMPGDVPDGIGSSNDSQRAHLQQKILKISEQIKIEQQSRDENVAEYLKLAKDADKQQAARIKSVFEKKNQKSKAIVMQLQKKLETYHRRLREIENVGPKSGKYGLKEVGAKLTDFSGGVVDSVKQSAAGIVSRPRGIATKLINKKFGSSDNIATLKEEDAISEGLERSNSFGDISVSTSGSGELSEIHQTNHANQSLANNQQSPVQIHLHPQVIAMKSQLSTIESHLKRLIELEAQHERVKTEIVDLSSQVKRDIGILTSTIEEGSYRCTRIEDQLHDLSEMHHREMGDIKQDLSSLEEKLEYHAQERARDIQEALESCQTRISKMEVQQQHQHQQLVTMEGVENATARALLGKLINLLLSVLAVILVFVSTVSSIVMPFVRSQTRIVITGLCVLIFAVLYRNWDPWTTYLTGLWSGR